VTGRPQIGHRSDVCSPKLELELAAVETPMSVSAISLRFWLEKFANNLYD